MRVLKISDLQTSKVENWTDKPEIVVSHPTGGNHWQFFIITWETFWYQSRQIWLPVLFWLKSVALKTNLCAKMRLFILYFGSFDKDCSCFHIRCISQKRETANCVNSKGILADIGPVGRVFIDFVRTQCEPFPYVPACLHELSLEIYKRSFFILYLQTLAARWEFFGG